ncbi:MAG TPA: DUF2961 domain-containing protein [Tepidiformaceae bacterium]|nr:DUF2961 domain-containing protein [Tepidiformaceae bacterium]
MSNWTDLSLIPSGMSLRSSSFENPQGAKGAGGTAWRGRKGAPSKAIGAGQREVLASIHGPATVRHFWIAFRHAVPEELRALHLEIFYDGLAEPSVSVPLLDFFGLPHGRFAEYYSAISSCHEGRSISTYLPIPVHRDARIEVINRSDSAFVIYYQLTWTTGELDPAAGYLHATFRRENPTTKARDFVILDGLRGPGRFAGCNVGIRTLSDHEHWYGEGEVKFYIDGDSELPTYCGTGLEDYVCSAWGLGTHSGHWSGSAHLIGPPSDDGKPRATDLASFYRWHGPDPVPFERDIKVTIQQMGTAAFPDTEKEAFTAWLAERDPAGWLWFGGENSEVPLLGGLYERVDDYCATAFVYCSEPQAVPVPGVSLATDGVGLLPYERNRWGWQRSRQLDQYLFEHWGSIAAPLPPAH